MGGRETSVLVGGPVRQKPAILTEHLSSLAGLAAPGMRLDCYFVDDNTDQRSSRILRDFCDRYERATVVRAGVQEDGYVCDEITHAWQEHLIWKVAGFKDRMLERGRHMNYDYVFLVDSDLVLHPQTLAMLVSTGKDIISEIFWTRWRPGEPELPQVWLSDQYTLHWSAPGERLTSPEWSRRVNEFLSRLRRPGVYRVGGLGACTLISAKALKAGVSFRPLYNLTFWGEDRHFCVRAVALGFTLYVDTRLPAYHVYRDSDLLGLASYKQAWAAGSEWGG